MDMCSRVRSQAVVEQYVRHLFACWFDDHPVRKAMQRFCQEIPLKSTYLSNGRAQPGTLVRSIMSNCESSSESYCVFTATVFVIHKISRDIDS
jgi:hypothetical protein